MTDSPNERHSRHLHPIKNMVELASYPASLAAGYLVARTDARRSVYKNVIRHDKELQKIQDERAARYQKDLFEPMAKMPPGQFNAPTVVKEIEHDYRMNVKAHFEKLGFKTWPDYWRGMTHSQKINALALGSTLAGIAIGAVMMITQNKALSAMMDRQDSGKDGPSPA